MKISKAVIVAAENAENHGVGILESLAKALKESDSTSAKLLGTKALQMKVDLEQLLLDLRNLARTEGQQG